MSEWRSIWKEALLANRQMIRDPNHSESIFAEVIEKYKNDGMVFYELAEAYEIIGNLSMAITNYEKAKRFFPVLHWKKVATMSIKRVNNLKQNINIEIQTANDCKWFYFHKFHSFVYLPEVYARYNSISAIAKISTESDLAFVTFRKSLEVALKELLNFNIDTNDSLDLLINMYVDKYGDAKHIKSKMDSLRKLGNKAIHSLDLNFSEDVWKSALVDYCKIMAQINEDLKTQDYYI